VYADMLHHVPSEAAAAEAAAAEAAAAPAAAAWTPERVASEVQSALQEVLGRRLEPSEPFMSGGWLCKLTRQPICLSSVYAVCLLQMFGSRDATHNAAVHCI
jgi:hypothetical protein